MQKLESQLFYKFFAAALAVSSFWSASAKTISFEHEYKLEDYKGQTYLNFMRSVVKPSIDKVATEGYAVKGPEAMEQAYLLSDTKVQRKVDRNMGGLDNVKEIAAALEGEIVTLNTLPGKIRAIDRRANAYDMATFIGLASGGGVSIEYATDNYALNVHYDTEEERSGRSFGVAPDRLANDASDKEYLKDLQAYSNSSPEDAADFYETLMEALLNSDTSDYKDILNPGQAVLTDFLAVFTAEQARNLMDGRISPHWDAALLEVTLLANFHAGQDEFKLYYQNPVTQEITFTNRTLKQSPCEVPSRDQRATMVDYWQYSRNINSQEHCRRSGINITKREFRKLGSKLTAYTAENNPDLYERTKSTLNARGQVSNLYAALSEYLISSRSPERLSRERVQSTSETWVEFLEYTRAEANNISAELSAE